MKKKVVGILIVMCCLCLAVAACAKKGNKADKGPQFAEGARTVYALGETITFDEYIENFEPSDENYSLVVTGDGFESDMTGRFSWTPEKVGKYVIVWTVKSGDNKGSVSIEITVEPPELTWEYTLDNTVYELGTTLVFEEFFEKMNMSVSPRPWSVHMDSVTVDGVKTEFSDADTQYAFTSFSEHVFEYHVETVYGQKKYNKQSVFIKRVDQETLAFLQANNITEYNAVAIYDGGVTLGNSSFNAGVTGAPRSTATPIDMSYLAYNGDYGVNKYLSFDYTGNNMPVIGFFVNKVTESMFNDGKGIVVFNGLTDNKGNPFATWTNSVNSRLNIFGPKKVDQPDNEAVGSMRATLRGTDMPFSMTYQAKDENKDTKFKMIIGVSDATPAAITVSACLINRETGKTLYKGNLVLNAKDYVTAINGSTVVKNENYTFADDYFGGNIVLWGQFGKNTAIDKIYPITEADGFDAAIDELFPISGTKHSHVADVAVGQELNVDDYFVKKDGYTHSLYYKDEAGNRTNVTGNTFSFAKAGKYTLVFNDGHGWDVGLDINVKVVSTEVMQWLAQKNVSFHDAEISADGSVRFGVPSYAGAETYVTSSNKSDVPYVSFNGNYGVNDYVIVDYTGNNMPAILFFGGHTTASYHYDSLMSEDENKGLVIANGLTVHSSGDPFENWKASVNNRLNVFGPYKIHSHMGNNAAGWQRLSMGSGTPLAMTYQAENGQIPYKLIVGISEATDTSFTVSAYLLNSATGEVLFNSSNTFTADFGTDYFSGNIALYGQYGKSTVIDKVSVVKSERGIEGAIPTYSQDCAFDASAPEVAVAGSSVSVSQFIGTADSFILTLIASDGSMKFITNTTFAVDKAGVYTLYYWDKNESHRPVSMRFAVIRNEAEDGDGTKIEFDDDNWLRQ